MISCFMLHPGVRSIQPRPTIIRISAGEYHAEIILEELFHLPINNLRKLFRLLYADRNADNSEAIQMITDYLPQAIAKAKDVWREASKKYADNCHTVDARGYGIPKARQYKLDRPLITAMKEAKANFERISKIQIIFQEIKNKEKKSCIKTTL